MRKLNVPGEQKTDLPIRIDVGCGGVKREGFIGLDSVPWPEVDHVLDLTKDRFPFDDATVDHVFSSHFLEHVKEPYHIFKEIGRVCKDGAKIEFWIPYAFSNEAFLYGHEIFLTEETWMHLYREAWASTLGGRWLLRNINYVVLPEIEREIQDHGFSMHFAIRYFKSVVVEFGIEIEFRRDSGTDQPRPSYTYSHSRDGERFRLDAAGSSNSLLRSAWRLIGSRRSRD